MPFTWAPSCPAQSNSQPARLTTKSETSSCQGASRHECLDGFEKLVRDLSGGAPSSLAEATQQPLVAEESATLIQGLGHAVRVHHQGLVRSQIDQLLLTGCRRGDTERRAARGQRLDVSESDD